MAITRDQMIAILAEADPVGLIANGEPGDAYDADLRRIALECQVAGGDDYELVFTAPAARRATLPAGNRRPRCA